MDATRRALLGTVATFSIAGCLDTGDGGGDSGMSSPTQSPTGTPAAAATVQVRSHGELGDILVGSVEMTLYMFDQDTQGEGASACSGGCASTWPPLTVDGDPTAGEDVTAELATFERADGGTQVMANGWPLYYYSGDESPGDTNGQGVGDNWWVLDADGVPIQPSETPTPTETDSGYY